MIKNSISEYDFYPFKKRSETDEFELVWAVKNKAIVRHSNCHFNTDCFFTKMAPYNGYVAIHNSEIPIKWQGNYSADGLQDLNIHGGITYSKNEGIYTVFGFDCAHPYDEKNANLYFLADPGNADGSQ